MKGKGYDPIELAEKIRPRIIDLENEKVLFARFSGTAQTKDGRVHTRIMDDFFRAKVYTKPEEIELNPFRGEPAGIAAQKLTISNRKRKIVVVPEECNTTGLCQVNGCNLRCWFCYVPDEIKNANPKYGEYFSAEEYLIQFFIWSKKTQNSINPDEKLNILRLSGGEVFLVPEIIFWMTEAIKKFGVQDYIYLWVDSNLSTKDFYWKYLTSEQRKKIRDFKNIGFMGCYKGFDKETFYETTGATPKFFDEQFKMHKKLIDEGLDVYSYLYLAVNSTKNLRKRLIAFMDRLSEEVDILAPLRLSTPIIKVYEANKNRLTPERKRAIENQWFAMKIWKEELEKRFKPEDLLLKPHEVPVRN